MKLLSSLAVAGLLLAASPLFAETVTVGPGQSLQEASDRLQPGDTLLLEEGTYYQSLKLTRSGTAGNPITIKAKAPGKVIITGAMETTPKFEQVEGAVYKTKWAAKNWKGSGTGQAWVIADDRNLYNFASMEEMKTFERGILRGQPQRTPQEGYFYQGEELYIRLLGGTDPNKAKVAISRPDVQVLLDIKSQEHIVLEGLRFHVAPSSAIVLGKAPRSEAASKHIVIRDCYFFGFHSSIRGQGSHDVTVEYCQFNNYPTYQWMRYGQLQGGQTWKAMYDSGLGGNAISPGGKASAWKIRHCYIHDCFDGIGVASTGDPDSALLNEYAYNLLHNCADDSIEFDAIEYAGVHAHHNVLLDGFCMLGLSPVQAGGVTIENNIVYVSPEYGLPWGVIFKFSTPSASAFWRGGFHPLTGITIRNNTLVNAKCGISWGTSPKYKPYFKENTVANNIIYSRDWEFCSGLPWSEGLAIEKNNLCVGPLIEAGKNKHAPPGVLWTRNKEPFVKQDTYFCDVMPPSLPGLVGADEIGEEKEIGRVNFSVSEEYVRAAIKESGFAEAEYKDVYKNLGAIPPGTKWEFPRPGPRWAVGESALFHPPLPPSLDPWWVGFADKPRDEKTVKIRPWRGKFYKKFEKLGEAPAP
jgi:hypothetical protein